jgi:hypothetical protein
LVNIYQLKTKQHNKSTSREIPESKDEKHSPPIHFNPNPTQRPKMPSEFHFGRHFLLLDRNFRELLDNPIEK